MRIKTVYLSIALTSLMQGGVALFAVYLLARGFDASEIVIPLSLMGVGGLIGSLIGGVLTDYFSPRKLGIALSSLWLLMPFGFSAENYYILCLTMLMVGVSLSSLRALYLATITSMSNGSEAEVRLSYRRFILNIGVAGGSALIGYLLKHEHNLFSYYFLFIGSITLLTTFYLPRDMGGKGCIAKETMSESPSNRKFVLLLLALLLALIPFSLIPNMYVIYLKDDIGLSESVLGSMFAFSGLLIAVLQIPLTKLLVAINGKLKAIVGVTLIGLGVGGVQVVQTELHLYVSTAIWTLGEIILFVPILRELLKYSPAKNGKTVASYQITFSISEILAPLVGGAIILTSYQMLWNLVLCLTTVSALILLFLYFKEKASNEYSLN